VVQYNHSKLIVTQLSVLFYCEVIVLYTALMYRECTITFVYHRLQNKYMYIGVLISLWLFLFPIFLSAAQPKEFFLDGLKKLEQ
jgi:hypothetical protein